MKFRRYSPYVDGLETNPRTFSNEAKYFSGVQEFLATNECAVVISFTDERWGHASRYVIKSDLSTSIPATALFSRDLSLQSAAELRKNAVITSP